MKRWLIDGQFSTLSAFATHYFVGVSSTEIFNVMLWRAFDSLIFQASRYNPTRVLVGSFQRLLCFCFAFADPFLWRNTCNPFSLQTLRDLVKPRTVPVILSGSVSYPAEFPAEVIRRAERTVMVPCSTELNRARQGLSSVRSVFTVHFDAEMPLDWYCYWGKWWPELVVIEGDGSVRLEDFTLKVWGSMQWSWDILRSALCVFIKYVIINNRHSPFRFSTN